MRILVVEDEVEIADGLVGVSEAEGFCVDAVYDGEDGSDYILSNAYDVILLDVMLPGINGFDVLRKARAKNINTPVIMLTAKSQIEDRV